MDQHADSVWFSPHEGQPDSAPPVNLRLSALMVALATTARMVRDMPSGTRPCSAASRALLWLLILLLTVLLFSVRRERDRSRASVVILAYALGKVFRELARRKEVVVDCLLIDDVICLTPGSISCVLHSDFELLPPVLRALRPRQLDLLSSQEGRFPAQKPGEHVLGLAYERFDSGSILLECLWRSSRSLVPTRSLSAAYQLSRDSSASQVVSKSWGATVFRIQALS